MPTLEELGAISRFIASVEHDLTNSEAYLDTVRRARDQASFCIGTGADDAS